MTHFELVKCADIARETHEHGEELDRLLSAYLVTWQHILEGKSQHIPRHDENRSALLQYLFPE